MTNARPSRRTDALILIASALAALAVAVRNDREVSAVFKEDQVGWSVERWAPGLRPFVGPLLRLESDLIAALFVATLGLGLIALRRPAAIRSGRWPGRGMAAISVGALAVAFGLARVAVGGDPYSASGVLSPSNPQLVHETLRLCEHFPKGMILGAWGLLAVAGRWRSGAGMLERSGRLLGWCWLASIAFDTLRHAIL